jgi:hypothetical protein
MKYGFGVRFRIALAISVASIALVGPAWANTEEEDKGLEVVVVTLRRRAHHLCGLHHFSRVAPH